MHSRFPIAPAKERVEFLLGEMTLQEKANFLCTSFPGVPRLGFPRINWGLETVHGLGRKGRATVFPSALSLAATFDKGLMEEVAGAIGAEVMALYHFQHQPEGHCLGVGRITWSPVINIYRDPRWGRGQETYGEDPELTASMALAYIRGLAGGDAMHPRVGCVVKHFAAHSGPEKLRHRMDTPVSLRDLHETYLPAFHRTLIGGGAVGLMGAYTRLNGEHCCASPSLLQKLLREEWGFKGLVVSDGGALADLHGESDLHGNHGLTNDPAESAAYALKRGCQICLGPTYQHLPEAVERGLVSEEDLDRVVGEVLEFAVHHRLLEWDASQARVYPLSLVASESHRLLARKAAVDSMTLLKNDGLLPLSKHIECLAVVGPYAASVVPLLGNYHGFSDRLVSPLEGLVGLLGPTVRLVYEPGCDPRSESLPIKWWTTHKPSEGDVIVAVMGIDPQAEGEEYDAPYADSVGDREHLGLPKAQHEYLEAILHHDVPVVLVLVSAGPLTVPEFFDHPNVRAIVHMGYSGQEGGNALADLLFGEANFSARLPVTWPLSAADLPPFEDYSMRNRTYRYATKPALVPFGFGLSYTHFGYEWEGQPPGRLALGQDVPFRVRVTNLGSVAGSEVVQVYLSGPEAGDKRPLRQLCTFSKIFLQPRESRVVGLTIVASCFSRTGEDGQMVAERGSFEIRVGGSQGDERSLRLGRRRYWRTKSSFSGYEIRECANFLGTETFEVLELNIVRRWQPL